MGEMRIREGYEGLEGKDGWEESEKVWKFGRLDKDDTAMFLKIISSFYLIYWKEKEVRDLMMIM